MSGEEKQGRSSRRGDEAGEEEKTTGFGDDEARDHIVGLTHTYRTGTSDSESAACTASGVLHFGESTRTSHDDGGLSFHDPEKGVISRSVLPTTTTTTTAAPSPSQSTRALTLPDDVNFYPEGGLQAWLVVFGSFCALLAALGIMNTLGSFQAYVSRNQLREYSQGQIGWVFSVYTCLAFGFGVIVGPVFDKHGARALMVTGSVGVVASLVLMSICEKYWHFMLVFGVLGGTCTSLIFTPSIAAIGHWFKRRRGFATGLGATGGAMGGIFFPLMMQYLIPKVGWAWAIRSLALLSLCLLIIGCVLVRGRLPPDHNATAKPDLGILRDVPFALTVAAVYLLEWAIFVPLTYISSYALHAGFSEDFSYQCLIILNIGSVFGRWLPGFYADKIGTFNTMILTTVLSVVMVLGVWLPAGTTLPGLIVFCLVFGFASGSNIGLTSVCVGKMCRTENLGRYFATCYTIVSLGCLTGVPIAGEILKVNGGEYWGLMMFTGLCYVGAVMAFVVVRFIKTGWDFRAVY